MTDSRTKGKGGEREAARVWRRWFPRCCRSYGQARDIDTLPDLLKTGFFYVEVKRYKNPSYTYLWKWWERLISDACEYEKETGMSPEPVLMWRPDGGEWRFALYANTLQDMGLVISQPLNPNGYGRASVISASLADFTRIMDIEFGEGG